MPDVAAHDAEEHPSEREAAVATATFLFTDIEGSTRLLQQLGDRYREALDQQRAIVRRAIAGSGQEEGTEGDSFFITFASASAAIAAAAAAQRALAAASWPEEMPVRVRMGIHTGEAVRQGGSLVGLDVHRAARIAAAAHGGQVLVSQATRTLVEASLPPGLSFRDLGSHRLKDLDGAERLHQLVIAGLPAEFPPPPSLDGPSNLPVQLTSFLGREREIAEVTALLDDSRLLTLTGPGGTGKTRLSLQVAARLADRYPDGVYFVALSALRDADLVAPTIARVLGLPDGGGRTPAERILDHLARRRVLLVLDNFEQLTAAAPLVGELLTGAPELTVLATSRQALHLYGEHEYAVPPLGVPSLGRHAPDLVALSQYESVALFIERATAVRPDFRVTNENAPAVAEICVRLDGLPLAIELAAARVRILAPQAILARLGRRLDLLSGGGSDRPERQQTLRGAIDWSYELLDERDRRLFAALSVFSGGASLELIEEVCGGLVPGDLLDGLTSLVDKSLVRQRTVGEEARFSQLHTIRDFALERADADGLTEGLRARHAAAFERLVTEAAGTIMGGDKRAWLDRLELEHDNLRGALGWAIERGDARLALHLSAATWRFWQMRGYLNEGSDWLGRALGLPAGPELTELRADATEAAGGLAWWRGALGETRDWYEKSLALRRELGEPNGIAEALYNLGFTFVFGETGIEVDEETVAAVLDEALALFESTGNRSGVGRVAWSRANALYFGGRDLDEARRYLAMAKDAFTELDDQFMLGWNRYISARVALDPTEPDVPYAARLLREALAIFAEARDVSAYTLVLDAVAQAAYVAGRLPEAARLSGAVDRLERETGTGLALPNRVFIGFEPARFRDDPALSADWAAGAAMATEDVVASAIAFLETV